MGALRRSVYLRAVPEIILEGGGPQALFCPVRGGCFVDNVSEGWGWVGGDNLSWGSKAYLIHSGAG